MSEPGGEAMTLARLSKRLGHEFHDEDLLSRALTHPSYRNESPAIDRDNQRLEFLGDSVLGLVIAERLFRAIGEADEGRMTQLKALCVSEPTLAEVARRLRLGELVRLGRGERRKGGARLNSVLGDALEAVLGAVLLDGGYLVATKVITRIFQPELDAAIAAGRAGVRHPARISGGDGAVRNWKTPLQELLQDLGVAPPQYVVAATDGPAHLRVFTIDVQVEIDGQQYCASGIGSSKKSASHRAAKDLYETLAERQL